MNICICNIKTCKMT